MIDVSNYSRAAQTVALAKYAQVGPRLFEALLLKFQTLEGILLSDEDSIKSIEGLNSKTRQDIVRAFEHLEQAERYVKQLKSRDISVISRFDSEYPDTLFELNDPPPLLYVRGAMLDKSRSRAAVVGAIAATAEGMELASAISKQLAEQKVQIVSSLYGGIDSAAHLAAHAAGGQSFAVIDRGFDSFVDNELIPLAVDISVHGGLISEYQPDQKKDKDSTAACNRLLSGLSQAVIVIEMYDNSGQLHDLLDFCNDNGKLAFMVTDTRQGILADESSLERALRNGVIVLEGRDKIDDIIRSLV